ncbi:MAG: GNAT family N-acetyltransferase [Anaerolineae bacterium]
MIAQLQTRAVTDKNRLQAFLNTDRLWHAYALADLAEPYFSRCRWLAAEEAGAIVSLVLRFDGLTPPALLAMGRADCLPALLAGEGLPPTAMMLGLEEHLPHLLAHYRPQYLDPMLRMALPARNFRPVPSGNALRLDAGHLPALELLYRNSRGNAFAPYQLEQGVFYGLFAGDELVSAAGTHIIAPEYGIAAVGNVCTRPGHRGRGYAARVTAAVCRHLLAQNLDIVLNVEQTNAPAVRLYQKLGFVEHCSFWEGVGERKG